MNSRLSRPVLALAVTGALVTGGSLVAGPAAAAPGEAPRRPAVALFEDPTPEPSPPTEPSPTPERTPTTEPTSEPTTEPTATTPTSPEPTATTGPTPEPTDTVEPAPDKVAPAGKFTLNTGALWIGQSVSLTQGAVSDDTTAPDQIERVVTWGDSTPAAELSPTVTTYKHKYTKNGKFTVTVTFTDAAGNKAKATSTVTVTTPGAFAFSKKTVWWHESFTVTFSKVPAGTSKIVFDQGDGYVETLKGKNQTARLYYLDRKNGGRVTGAVTLRATFHNKYGASSAIWMGKVTVKADNWKPTTTVKKPKNSNRIKSWKYATGTAADKGSGVYRVAVFGSRLTGDKFYCYSSKNTWKRVNSDADAERYCVAHYVKAKKGKWSLRLKGVAKGTLWIDASTQDISGNWGKFKTVKVKITRS